MAFPSAPKALRISLRVEKDPSSLVMKNIYRPCRFDCGIAAQIVKGLKENLMCAKAGAVERAYKGRLNVLLKAVRFSKGEDL